MVQELPDGLKTKVDEAGLRFSGENVIAWH